MKIGAQLYTVRPFTQTKEDFDTTIKKIADIGYKYVQISAIGPIPAQDIKDICDKHNISVIVSHTNPKRVKDETQAVIDEHKIMGASFIGIGAMPGGYSRDITGVRSFIADYKPAAKLMSESGMKFMYHNHAFEFEKYDNRRMIEILAEEFNDIGFIVDTYWVQRAGGDPAWWLRYLKGRVWCIHFKDMKHTGGKEQECEVMEGNLNWDTIFDACFYAGVEYAFVEQDSCYGEDEFLCLKKSFDNLRSVL